MSSNDPRRETACDPLPNSLAYSHKEAIASATMTATCDNFLNPFAIFLKATSIQMGFLTAVPQLFGAMMQLVSVWLGAYVSRRLVVVIAAFIHATIMIALAGLAIWNGSESVETLTVLWIAYQALASLIQPQWRAWMGSIVPSRQRGVFFAARTRRTMATALLVFLGGGFLLTGTQAIGYTWLGFFTVFTIAAIGRFFSAYFMYRMHDPVPNPVIPQTSVFYSTLYQIAQSLKDRTFRNYTFFVAGMQGMVAISAPFFAVYMLNELHFTYLQYTVNLLGSIGTQFFTLRFWGKYSDSHGNRLVMLLCSAIIPVVPVLWLVSANFYYLLSIQVISGVAWSGFTLTTANYLYDIRPHHTNFAVYAAVQSGISAALVFCGAITGGYIASAAPVVRDWLPFEIGSALFLVFLFSGIMRALVLSWFIPRAEEPKIRTRPQLLQIIFRIARFNSISGVVLDWLTVTEKGNKNDK